MKFAATSTHTYDGSAFMAGTIEVPNYATAPDYVTWREQVANVLGTDNTDVVVGEERLFRVVAPLLRSVDLTFRGPGENGEELEIHLDRDGLLKELETGEIFGDQLPHALIRFVVAHTIKLFGEVSNLGN